MKSPLTGKFTIPAQKSAQDTTNWDDRAFTTPQDDREVIFKKLKTDVELHTEIVNPYLEQEQRKATKRSKKLSK